MWPSYSRFLTRLRAGEDQVDDRRPELVIAISRAVLAGAALLAVYIDPTDPEHFRNVVRLMLLAYLVHSILIWLHLRFGTVGRRTIVLLHLVDTVFPVAVAFFSGGPSSPFFLFFPFAIVFSAFRWGAVESLATAAATIVLLVAETLLMGVTGQELAGFNINSSELNRIFLRCVYLAMLGAMIGMLGEREKEWRAEDTFINRVLKGIRAERGFSETMHFVIREFLKLYRGKKAVVTLHALATGRFYQYELYRDRPSEHPGFIEMFGEEGRLRMLPDRAPTFYVSGERADSDPRWMSLEGSGQIIYSEYRSPAGYYGFDSGDSALCTSFQFGSEWTGRLMLVDARLGPKREDELRFAEKLMRSIGPAVYSVYLVRRLRNRISAVERARVARELHDGAIQSLIAVEMEVDVLRRQAAQIDSEKLASDLDRIQQLLREEVLQMRELMQQLKPAEVSPEQFLDFVSSTVDRFRRDSGIDITLRNEVQQVDLSPQQCRELGRIVQEALVNVRKHSGANRAVVALARLDGRILLTVEDNGCGFGFSGRLNSEQLTAARLGPTIIQERVRSMGAELEIESVPGKGARLQVALPRKGNRAHG